MEISKWQLDASVKFQEDFRAGVTETKTSAVKVVVEWTVHTGKVD